MHYNKYLIIFLISFVPATLFAQDITGLWKGTLYNDSTQKFYRYEIGISEEKGKLSGFSHTFFIYNDKEFYGVKRVKVKKADGKIIIEENGLIANNYPVAPAKGVRQLNILTLEIKDSVMTLTGPFTTNRTKEYAPLTGTISLQRKNDFWQSALVPHLQELGLSNDLSFVKEENEKIKAEEAKKKAENDIALNKATATAKKEKTLDDVDQPVKPEQKPVQTTDKAPQKTEPVKNETAVVRSAAAKEDVAVNTTAPEKPNSVKQVETKPVAAEESATAKKNDEKKKAPQKNETAVIKPAAANEAVKTAPKEETNKEQELKKTDKEAASKTSIAKTEITAIKAPVKNNAPAAEVDKRTTVLQQTVYFTSDSLQISLYDNGEVDGDTVSVLMNGKVIMAKEGLSTNAVRKTIYADPSSESIELLMYAENLGSIPPNTGLLVVHDGKSIYEIRFSGDLQKNASIILRRRKN